MTEEAVPEYTPQVVETHVETGEPEHWPTERMISEDNGRYAAWSTPDDLKELDDRELQALASLCLVPTYQPDECIPCLAAVTLAEKYQQVSGQSGASPGEEEIPFEDAEERETPKLDHLLRVDSPVMSDGTPWEQPVADRFAAKVTELNALVTELLHGPPIPPPGVTLEDLSLLAVAAQRWIKITEAQGIDLPSNQQAVLDATKAVVARLNRG